MKNLFAIYFANDIAEDIWIPFVKYLSYQLLTYS